MQVPPPLVARAAVPGGSNTQAMSLRAQRPPRRKLGEILIVFGKLTEARLQETLERQRLTGGRLGELLVAEGLVTEEDVVRALSEQSGLPFISAQHLRTMPVPTSLLALLPVEKAERHEAVPVALQNKELLCAMREPRDLARLDELKFITGCAVRGIFATAEAVRIAIGRFYRNESPDLMEGWGTIVPTGVMPALPVVTPRAEQHTGVRERLLDASSFEELEPLEAAPPPPPPAPAPVVRPPPPPAPVVASLARTMLVVADDAELRETAVRLLARQGVAVAGSCSGDVEKAVALGGTEVALVAADTLTDAPAVVARLMTVAPRLEVRVLPSLAEALCGEAGPLGRTTQLHARVLGAALAALGGVGVHGAALAQLARRVTRRLGAGQAESERASAVAYALALAAQQEAGSGERFVRPSCESVRAVLGRDAGELAGLIAACTRDAPPPAEGASRGALALAAAVALIEMTGTATLGPTTASQALSWLRSAGRLPATALEALAAELMDMVLGDSASHTVVLAEPNAARAAALQARFLADGVRVVLADSAARVRALLAQQPQALVVSAQLPDGDGASLTRSLRSAGGTASLPIFVLAPPEDPALVEAGLDAGADDVLTYPVNPDVLVAKLRRALTPRRTPAPAMTPPPVPVASLGT
jgi:serine/threonine-protein kinase